MENTDNKIIALKLAELDTLPKGYASNLQSKWELLEASLDGHDKNRKTLYIWVRIAAVLIVFCSLGTLFLQHSKKSPLVQTKMQEAKQPLLKQDETPAFSKNEKSEVVHKKSIPSFHKPIRENIATATLVIPELISRSQNVSKDSLYSKQNSFTEFLSNKSLSVKKKKNRYIQFDFTDSVNSLTASIPKRPYFAKNLRVRIFNNNDGCLQNTTQTNSTAALFKINL